MMIILETKQFIDTLPLANVVWKVLKYHHKIPSSLPFVLTILNLTRRRYQLPSSFLLIHKQLQLGRAQSRFNLVYSTSHFNRDIYSSSFSEILMMLHHRVTLIVHKIRQGGTTLSASLSNSTTNEWWMLSWHVLL